MLRTRILSNWMLRTLARGLVHLQPERLGAVSEGFEGVFRMRPCGYTVKYELGPNDAVGNVLLWCGPKNFEPVTLPVFAEHAKTARGILDIGANTGLYTLLACAANPRTRVIAWEPVPYLHSKLVTNVAHNGFVERCDLRQSALADEKGILPLYVPADTTMASLNSAHGNHSTTPINVTVETVDETVPEDFPLDLIKLDVETYEFQVLCGMRKSLARHRPKLIFECLPTSEPEPIERLLVNDLGYRLFRLTERGQIPVSSIRSGESHSDHNYLAVM